MTQYKVGQKWRTRGGDIREIEEIRSMSGSQSGLYLDDGTHRYSDGSYYDDEIDEGDLLYLIEDAPQDDLHPCLERVEKLVVKEGVYGRFKVAEGNNRYIIISFANSGTDLSVALNHSELAEAAALFTALAMATGEAQ